ncbi:hypothetical protein [Gaetbulibacter sp. NE]|uniref:hypothetical protein n=1 Tax=Gaetbulibacter sp. NE TaxID=2982307 RepID=UPI0021D21FB3|nr:hypothetical protein [Gaetbulibacter sp. NE]
MNNFKKIILEIPEYFLIASVIFYWFSTGLTLNYIAITLIAGLILQIIFKNKVVGISIPSLLIVISLYMILAVLSEVSEFPSFNTEAQTLLLVGLLYFIATIVISIIMIYKYAVIKSIKSNL